MPDFQFAEARCCPAAKAHYASEARVGMLCIRATASDSLLQQLTDFIGFFDVSTLPQAVELLINLDQVPLRGSHALTGDL